MAVVWRLSKTGHVHRGPDPRGPSLFFFYAYASHRDLHSFPTRRSSDLGELPQHPVLSAPGWWVRREDRHYCTPVTARFSDAVPDIHTCENRAPILITGGTDTLGSA